MSFSTDSGSVSIVSAVAVVSIFKELKCDGFSRDASRKLDKLRRKNPVTLCESSIFYPK